MSSINALYNYSNLLLKALEGPDVPIGDVERAIIIIEANDRWVPNGGSQRSGLVVNLRKNLNEYRLHTENPPETSNGTEALDALRTQAQAYYAVVRNM